MASVAIVGGSGVVWEEEASGNRMAIDTRYGPAEIVIALIEGQEVVLMPRHGFARGIPPHLINYRANIAALKEIGIETVIATAAVGSLTERLAPGSLALVTDFLDFTRNRPFTFFDQPGELVHTDFSKPYCHALNEVLLETSDELEMTLDPSAVYACAEGPRYETPAEIRMFRMLGGEVIGMTGVPEVVLAHEAGLCYSTIAIITNWAAGMVTKPITHEEVLVMMKEKGDQVQALIRRAIGKLSSK